MVLPFYRRGHSAAIVRFEWFIRVHADPDGTHRPRAHAVLGHAELRPHGARGPPIRTATARTMQLPEQLLSRRTELAALLEGTTDEQMGTFVTEGPGSAGSAAS